MSDQEGQICPRCRTPLPPELAIADCPSCLLQLALGDDPSTAHPDTPLGAIKPESTDGFRATKWDYDRLEEIGSGGMGIVCKGWQRSLNRTVAIKFLDRLLSGQTEMLDRFRREATVAAQMKHSNIVPIYDVGEFDGRPYYTMEWIEGPDLSKTLNDGPLSPKKAAEWIRQIADAVEHAHSKNVLHRDLKPANVLIDLDGTPRLTDFGLARYLDSSNQTVTQQALGSPPYMAPEQAIADYGDVNAKTDVYGLGALLYHTITGRPPFLAANRAQVLNLVHSRDPVAPRVLNPILPRDLETICLKCLEKEPQRRYPSANAVAEDLSRFLSGRSTVARPLNPFQRGFRWIRREPIMAAFGIAIVCVIIAGMALIDSTRKQRLNERSAHQMQALIIGASGRIGHRFDALATIKKAASLGPNAGLRDQAITALARVDLSLNEKTMPLSGGTVNFDEDLTHLLHLKVGQPRDVTLFNFPDGDPIHQHELDDPSKIIHGAILSPSAEFFIILTRPLREDKTGLRAEIWRWSPRTKILELPRANQVVPSFSKRNQEVAMYDHEQNAVLIHDIANDNRVTHLACEEAVHLLDFSSDGKRLVGWNLRGSTLHVWDRDSANKTAEINLPTQLFGYATWDGSGQVLAAAGTDYRIYVCDVDRERIISTLIGHSATVHNLTFHPQRNLLASWAWDRSSRLWNPFNAKQLIKVEAYDARQFNSTGAHLSFKNIDSMGTWSISEGRTCRYLNGRTGLGTAVTQFAFSNDSRWLASASPRGIHLWELSTGQIRGFLNTPAYGVAFGEASDTLFVFSTITSNDVIRYQLDQTDGTKSVQFLNPIRLGKAGNPRGEPIGSYESSNGRLLSWADRQGKIKVFDTKSFTDRSPQGHSKASVFDASMSPSGRWITTCERGSSSFKVRDSRTGDIVAELKHEVGLDRMATAFSHDDRWVVTGNRHEYRVWESTRWQSTLRIPRVPGSLFAISDFSPVSPWVAVSVDSYSVDLYDLESKKHVGRFQDPNPSLVTWISFSPDCQYLGIGANDHTIQLWNLHEVTAQLGRLGLKLAPYDE